MQSDSEKKFRLKVFQDGADFGYFLALTQVFDQLTECHQEPGFDRKFIDAIWDRVKKLEDDRKQKLYKKFPV